MSISSIVGGTTALISPRARYGAGSVQDSGDQQPIGQSGDAFRSDFSSLLDAVKAGDMTAAQSALSTLTSDLQSSSSPATYSPTSGPSDTQSRMSSDLSALFTAVRSGDSEAAKTALATFQTDVASQTSPDASGSSAASANPPADAAGQSHHGAHHAGHHHLKAIVSQLLGSSSTTSDGSADAPSTTSTAQSA